MLRRRGERGSSIAPSIAAAAVTTPVSATSVTSPAFTVSSSTIVPTAISAASIAAPFATPVAPTDSIPAAVAIPLQPARVDL